MWILALYALIIFVVFAVVGGLAVRFIIRNQQDPSERDLRPRGMASDVHEDRD